MQKIIFYVILLVNIGICAHPGRRFVSSIRSSLQAFKIKTQADYNLALQLALGPSEVPQHLWGLYKYDGDLSHWIVLRNNIFLLDETHEQDETEF